MPKRRRARFYQKDRAIIVIIQYTRFSYGPQHACIYSYTDANGDVDKNSFVSSLK
jgi:hypothetical protein